MPASDLRSTPPADPTFTRFAPPERKGQECVLHQATHFEGSPLAEGLLNSGINALLVLNSCRQIIAASSNVLPLTICKTIDELLGKRPGEALGCVHAFACPNGCGTSDFCRECGAVRAILAGIAGQKSTQECRLTRSRDGIEESLDLQVLATPIVVNTEKFTFLAITDISHEKRRRALERIFFHDVINLAGGIQGLLSHLKENAPDDIASEIDLSCETVSELIDEIVTQRDLAAAELKTIAVDPLSGSMDIVTDQTLLRRVLGNLVKNASEACKIGQQVGLSCKLGAGKVTFSVSNPQVMPPEVQLQVFQRSFTTKGQGRGLGTYSVKLLTERFLKGSVSFSSSEASGTVFRIVLPVVLQ